MTKRTPSELSFPRVQRRSVELNFEGGNITSDGGALLLREAERMTGLLRRVAGYIGDPRRVASCDHDFGAILRQRVFGIALGYEDLNDHEAMRHDIALQTAVGRDVTLAHPATICRLEQKAQSEWASAAHQALFEHFVASFDEPPEEVVLDFDATDDQVHGEQIGRHFHGHYGGYCFLPLYVFCGEHLLVALLRRSSEGGAAHADEVLARLVHDLRAVWPDVRIVFRADGGFSKADLLKWCDDNSVDYVVGYPRNPRIVGMIEDKLAQVEASYAASGVAERVFDDLQYKAGSWDRIRRVIAKAEYLPENCGRRAKRNPRFVVTNMEGDARTLYEEVYCARGEMENRIKEQQLDLFADRTSCHDWRPNQWRLLLAGLAYALMETIRRVGLAGTTLARAQCGTIRLKLLKIGAVLLRNTRRVRFLLSSACPYKELLCTAVRRLQRLEPTPIGTG